MQREFGKAFSRPWLGGGTPKLHALEKGRHHGLVLKLAFTPPPRGHAGFLVGEGLRARRICQGLVHSLVGRWQRVGTTGSEPSV